MMRIGSPMALVLGSAGWVWLAPSRQLSGVDLDVTEVADSGAYFVYSYELNNPSASTWGLVEVRLDISAAAGTPNNLAVTGNLFDLTNGDGAAVLPHAEVGPISPTGWRAILDRVAELTWSPGYSATQSRDSVAPGASRSGFGIRSSYLPGIRDVYAAPTVESCCFAPADSADGEYFYPTPGDFTVEGSTIGPQYPASEVTIDLLQSQLATVCTDPLWLDDEPLCDRITDSLAEAEARMATNNYNGATGVLDALRVTLQAEQGSMDARAFWMLYRNVDQVYENLSQLGGTAANRVPG